MNFYADMYYQARDAYLNSMQISPVRVADVLQRQNEDSEQKRQANNNWYKGKQNKKIKPPNVCYHTRQR